MKNTILVTSGRSPAGLDLLRTFSRHGHRVIVADSFPVHLCQFSRFGNNYRVPSPSREPFQYVQRIGEIVQQESVDLIIPVYEEIFPLTYYRDRIGCRILGDDFEKLRKLHSKFEFIELCRKAGCSYPETKLISSKSEIDDPSNQVIKPVYSRFGTGVYLKPTQKEIESIKFEEPCVLQEYAQGKPFCGFCLARDGEVLLQSIYPVEPTLSGVCITYRHEPVSEIAEWMNQFVRHIKFTGSIGFDLVLSGDRVLPIECNPRITSGIHLFSGSQAMVDGFLDQTAPSRDDKSPAMAGPFVFAKAMLNWSLWKKWFSSKDVIFNWTDPLPLLGLGIVFGYMRMLAWRKGMPMSEVSSLDIEYNGEEFAEDPED